MDIHHLINEIDLAKTRSQHGWVSSEDDRQKLLKSAISLVSALSKPEDEAWKIINGPTMSAVVKSAMRMKLFDAFNDESMSAAEIAVKVKAHKDLIGEYDSPVRLMRALIALGVFDEVGEEQNMIDHWMMKLPDFLESIDFCNPLETHNGLLQYANKTNLSTIQWLERNPKELACVGEAMTAWTSMWQKSTQAAISNLIASKMESFTEDEEEVLIVDVGGGRGAVLQEIRAQHQHLKGRMICQDVPGVIVGHEEVGRIESMAHDFFTPQPVKGAHIYLFRHVLHDWSDEACRRILVNTIPALAHYSCIAIIDQVVPARGASLASVGVDISMMSFSGMERSEKQWKQLLSSAGLRVVKITSAPLIDGENCFDSVIEVARG